MANIKISQLTAKGATLESTDVLEIAEDAGGGTYVTKSITGAEIIASGVDTNFANTALTFTANRTHDLAGYKATLDNAELKIIADANTSGDVPFEVTQSDGTTSIFKVFGDKNITTSSAVFSQTATTYTSVINVEGDGEGVLNLKSTAGGGKLLSLQVNYFGNAVLQNNTGALAINTSSTLTLSATGAIIIPPITATAASALTPAEGMELNVSNTNGTFTSIGKWQYIGGAWVKL